MQKAVSGVSAPATFILRRILLIYYGLAIASFIFRYLGGESSKIITFTFLSWTYAAILSAFFEYGRRLPIPPRSGRIYGALFLIPALVQIGQDVTISIGNRIGFRDGMTDILLPSLFALEIGFSIFILFFLRSSYLAHITSPNIPVAEPEVPASSTANSSITNIPSLLLGQGDSYIDRVIRSVVERSVKSERVASFSLIIMLILVTIGGMASFGLWIFTHADRINTLEAERNKLIQLRPEIKDVIDKLNAGSEDAKARLDSLVKFINQNYSTSETYEATLNRLNIQSQTNYADIAIRVTIAVLTIFLVQVFFAVYKYNRHLAIMLAAKAEAIELAGNDEDSRKELSREAVSIVKENVPGFGAHPKTPLEDVIQAVDKLRKRE